MKADLHMHTHHSDGALSTKELIRTAIHHQLDCIAITDHDTLKGVHEAMLYDSNEIKIIPGIELSTTYHGESVHVLGYFKNIPDLNGPLQTFMDNQIKIRDERAKRMVDLIKQHFHIEIDADDLFNKTASIITRGHIADVIRKKYPEYSNDELFKTVLSNESKAYIASTKISTEDGIKLLKDSGALVIIAHPGIYKKLTFDKLFELDVDGIEALYKSHDETFRKSLIKEVKKHQMIYTGGSDFHGDITKNHADLGEVFIEGTALKQFLKRIDALI
jgi:3',5'-nucleoside bisphosphate phosphatase